MAGLRKCIEAMEVGSEERKMGVREWRRLKRIPQGSVETGVIRSYVGPSPSCGRVEIDDWFVAGMADLYPMAQFYRCILSRPTSIHYAHEILPHERSRPTGRRPFRA
jgi:hypothetical protein